MTPAPDTRLRPGWYPDPDGDEEYRYFDGADWTDRTAPVPAARRAKFIAQQNAMARTMGTTPSARTGARATLRSAPSYTVEEDPGKNLGIAALIVCLSVSTIIALILARMSRTRSNEAGLERNGFAKAALIVGMIRLIIIALAIVFAVLIPTLSSDGGSKRAGSVAARAAIKEAVNNIETCAATNKDGTYGACATPRNAALRNAGVTRCAGSALAAGATCVLPIGTGGYVVKSMSPDDVAFVERHGPGGTLTKTCAPTGPECETGNW